MAFDYPNGPEDSEGILRYRDDVNRAHQDFWQAVELQAWKNILFYLGIQNIVYSPSLRFWRPLVESARKPVTNKVKMLVNDLASKLVAFKPPITWGPGSDQEADYVAASVADRVNTSLEREANIRELKPIAARWLGCTGNAWLVNNFDIAPEWGTRFIPASRCLGCLNTSMPADIEETQGTCPQCGMAGAWEPAVDGSGTPVGVEYPKGRHVTELENVFTVRFDPTSDRFHKSPYVKIARMRPKSWVAEHYSDEIAAAVQFSRTSASMLHLFETLALTAYSTPTHAVTGANTGGDDQAMVDRLWIRPHPVKAPGGIYAEIVGDVVVLARDYPYHDERGKPMLNVTHLEFDQVPGRALAATRLDDVVGIQEDLNEYDAYLKIHARRMANAVYLEPRGSNIARLTGEVGVRIQYDPLPTGHKPERLMGMDVPATMLNVRNMRKMEMDEVWGSLEVSRGEAPRGITAYAALQMLDERAQQGQSNLFDNWALGWMEWSRQNLNIYREYADEERTISLGVGRWATKKFTNAQMEGGVDMTIELGTNRPMTMIAKSARIGQAIQEGIVNIFDPQVRFLALRALGIPELMPDYNKDYEKAGRVVDQILSATTPQELPAPPQPFDNHSIHLSVLRQVEIDEMFETLEDWKKQAILLRSVVHFQALREEALNTMSKAGQNAPSPRGGGGEGGGGKGKSAPDAYTTEQSVMDIERQGASPDTLTGAKASATMAAQ